MSISWKYLRRGFAALLIALGAHATVFAQTPTFSLEGVVSDAQQAVLPGATVTIYQHGDRAHPHGGHRRRVAAMWSRRCRPKGDLRVLVELTGFANAVREDIVFNAGQRAPH